MNELDRLRPVEPLAARLILEIGTPRTSAMQRAATR